MYMRFHKLAIESGCGVPLILLVGITGGDDTDNAHGILILILHIDANSRCISKYMQDHIKASIDGIGGIGGIGQPEGEAKGGRGAVGKVSGNEN